MLAAQEFAITTAVALAPTHYMQALGNWLKQHLKIAWLLGVISSLVITALIYFFLPADIKYRITIINVYWAAAIGGTILLFVPSKTIITGFGTILGISGSDVTTGAGIISKAHKAVTAIALEIESVAKELGANPDVFFTQMLWLFVIVFGLILVFAFLDPELDPAQTAFKNAKALATRAAWGCFLTLFGTSDLAEAARDEQAKLPA
jgi:hypothetical protein